MARELAGIGFARTGFERDDGRMDLSQVTGGQAAVLQTKRQSLMDLAKLCGWIVEKHDEVSRLAERVRNMTDAERIEDARQLAERIRARLAQDRLQTIEGKATEIEDPSLTRQRKMRVILPALHRVKKDNRVRGSCPIPHYFRRYFVIV